MASKSKVLVSDTLLSEDEKIAARTISGPTMQHLRGTRTNPARTVYVYKLGLADLDANGELPNARTYKVHQGTVITAASDAQIDNLDSLFGTLGISTARGKLSRKHRKNKKNKKTKSKRNHKRKHSKKSRK
jgi:hypothetical protein